MTVLSWNLLWTLVETTRVESKNESGDQQNNLNAWMLREDSEFEIYQAQRWLCDRIQGRKNNKEDTHQPTR